MTQAGYQLHASKLNQFGFSLTKRERVQLMGWAFRTALLWSVSVGFVWYVIWLLVPNEESALGGLFLMLVIFVCSFVWKRNALLRRVEAMWLETAKRHKLDEIQLDSTTDPLQKDER